MTYKKPDSNPSELATSGYSPNVWKRIREQNAQMERERNRSRAPVAHEAPRAWLFRTLLIVVSMWIFL